MMRKDSPAHSPNYWTFDKHKRQYKFIHGSLRQTFRRLFIVELKHLICHTYCRLFFKKHSEEHKSPDWGGIDWYCKHCRCSYRTGYKDYHAWGNQLQAPITALDLKK